MRETVELQRPDHSPISIKRVTHRCSLAPLLGIIKRRGAIVVVHVLACVLLFTGFWVHAVQAGPLVDRLATFPDWQGKPPVQPADGDLVYPDWFSGTWTMTSTLVDLVAPLAPQIVTPGFESNRQYLNQPVVCQVRFVDAITLPTSRKILSLLPLKSLVKNQIVADRAFNGLNLARAYLGEQTVLAVKVDPSTPNRQITLLPEGRQLVSVVTARAVETPDPEQFVTTEIFQQVFRGIPNPYLNQVETTTAYQHLVGDNAGSTIVADQITAIYLSPQDPQFFEANDRPVALYRYRLELSPSQSSES